MAGRDSLSRKLPGRSAGRSPATERFADKDYGKTEIPDWMRDRAMNFGRKNHLVEKRLQELSQPALDVQTPKSLKPVSDGLRKARRL